MLIIRTRSNVKFAQPHIWWKKALNFPSHMVSLQGSGCKPPALSPLCASPLELLGPSSSCTHSLGFECWLSAWAFWFNMSVWGTFKNSIYYLSNTVTTSFFCFRSLGLNTVTAYQRAKVSALKIVNLGMGNPPSSNQQSKEQRCSIDEVASVQVDLEPPPQQRSPLSLASSIPVPPQTPI